MAKEEKMKRFFGFMFVVLCIAMSVSSARGQDDEENKIFTIMVAMRDDAKLSTLVYLPEGNAPYPAILIRTPYGKKLMAYGPANKFLPAGYALVVQDTRGRFDSEGEQTFIFSTETNDGHDTIDWIAKQKWSDGRVGTYGPSAMGITQYALIPDAPKALKCAYVHIASANLPEIGMFHGNVFRLSLVSGWLNFTRVDKGPLNLLYAKGDNVKKLIDTLNYEKNAGRVNIPVAHIGGWFDIFAEGNINAFNAYQKHGGAGAKGKQKLVMGPWTHLGAGLSLAKDFVFAGSEDAVFDAVDWFDKCIKNENGGVDSVPAVQYFTMTDVSKRETKNMTIKKDTQWPPKSAATTLYLTKEKTLSAKKPAGKGTATTFASDPKNPVPFLCGAELILNAGSCDQRKVEKRSDVLVFTSEPLTQDTEVTGSVDAVVYFSSSGKDTDIAVKLTDVFPDGRSMLVVDGVQRARYMNGWDNEKLLESGKVYKMNVHLGVTSVVFKKGHQIRVAISSSNFPRFIVNPNTGGELSLSMDAVNYVYKTASTQLFDVTKIYEEVTTVDYTIYMDAAHPSQIILPVIK